MLNLTTLLPSLLLLGAGAQALADSDATAGLAPNSKGSGLSESELVHNFARDNTQLPTEQFFGDLETVFEFNSIAMPTGVTVSEDGRIFVCFPNWGDDNIITVGEIVNDRVNVYPNYGLNLVPERDPKNRLVSVQSVVADGHGTLWILDTAAPSFSPPIDGAAKLVAVDLSTNTVRKMYYFPNDVVLNTTYLNDVRIDLRVGKSGYAYITDSSIHGPGAIIVLDLETGESFRRLNGDVSVSPDPLMVPKVEGKVWMNRPANGAPSPVTIAADSLAISPDGKTLYYAALSSRHLYSIDTASLRDKTISDADLSKNVKYITEKGASDGMITDENGVVYAGDYENNAIHSIKPDGTMDTIVHDSRILWPDTLAVGPDGYLYFTNNQLPRQAGYNEGKDTRQRPFSLLKINIGAKPAPVI